MPTLLEIASEFAALDALLIENGGDLSDPAVDQAVSAWMAELQSDLDGKVDAYAAYIRELQLRAAARREESERIAKAAKTNENTVSWLKERLKTTLAALNIQKAGHIRTASICGNGGKPPLVIDEGAEIPSAYLRIVTSPDVELIRKSIESGECLPFARLAERGTHLRIT